MNEEDSVDQVSLEQSTDFLHALMRDMTSSHIMESLLSHCAPPAFTLLWDNHFKGKISRLASHPIANFVLSKALAKINEEQLEEVLEELKEMLNKAISMYLLKIRAMTLQLIYTIVSSGADRCFTCRFGESRDSQRVA